MLVNTYIKFYKVLIFSCIINFLGQTKDVNVDYICNKGENYTEKEHNALIQKDRKCLCVCICV